MFSNRSNCDPLMATYRLCKDCMSHLPPVRASPSYCNTCYEVRKTYSQVCITCKVALISLESEDFVDVCQDCSIIKHKCATEDCQNMIAEHWKTLCASCFSKSRTLRPVITEQSIICSKCPNPVDASWQKLCTPCYNAEPRQRTPIKTQSTRSVKTQSNGSTPVKIQGSAPTSTGIFQCQTVGCEGTTDQKWKTMCLSCYKAR